MAGEDVIFMMQFLTILSLVFFITTAVFGVLAVALAKFTPGLTFLKAKLKGQNIIMVIRRDRKADFSIGKYSAGIIETKKYGDYITDPEGVMNESKSGTRLFVASTELGVTISPKIAKIIQGLQDAKIPNIQIAKMINSRLNLCKDCNTEVLGEPHQQVDAKTNKVIQWFACPKCEGKNLTKVDLGTDSLDVDTLKFENLEKWSEKIMNPVFQASNKELKVQEAMQDYAKPKINTLLTLVGIGIMVFLICMGVYVLLGQVGNGHAVVQAVNPITQVINQSAGGIMQA